MFRHCSRISRLPGRGFVALAVALLPSLAHSHHSKAIYDTQATVTVTGSVTRIQWTSPHAYITLEGKVGWGETRAWMIELLNPASMGRAGWNRSTLVIGDELSVTGSPASDSSNASVYPYLIYRGEERLFADKDFYEGEAATNSPPETGATSIAGIWKSVETDDVRAFLTSSTVQELTPQGENYRASYDDATMNFALDCGQLPAPASMLLPSNTKRIAITAERVVIESDYDGSRREIRLNSGQIHTEPPTTQGFSTGRWEGSVLVVESSLFAPNSWGNGRGIRSGTGKTLTERFQLRDDGRAIEYSFTLNDPEMLAAPLAFSARWIYRPDIEFLPDQCSLDSARQFLNP